jgi:predicted metal-dependent peptidase
VKELMRAAWEQSVKARGAIPGFLERELAALVQADQVPWDVLLAEAIVAARRTRIVDAMATPNLALLAEDEFEPWPGQGLDPEFGLVWITDTSGSVKDAEYLRAIAVLNSLLAVDRRIRCRHILIDAVIEKEVEVDNLEGPRPGDHRRVGYGGTCYRGAFKRILARDGPEDWAPEAERCEEAPSPPDLVIVFTDGGVWIKGECFPEYRPACPIIWLVAPDAPSRLPDGMEEGQGDRVIRMVSRG